MTDERCVTTEHCVDLPDDAIGRSRKYTNEEKQALEELYQAMRSRPTLGSTVVSQPEPHHRCGPNRYGYWFAHNWAPHGTVVRCDDCGRTWVSIPSGQPGVLVNRWRREGRIERWRRERRARHDR